MASSSNRPRTLSPAMLAIGLQPHRNVLTPPPTPAAALHYTMRNSTVDLFVLTFNCAKNVIDVDVFARHLRGALVQPSGSAGGVTEGSNGVPSELPDLVIFSLQEISPLAQSYLGGQFLNPYLNPFKEALNLAALEIEQQSYQPADGNSSRRPTEALQRSKTSLSGVFRRQPDYPYKLIEARNVGMTAIMLFARKPDAIHHIQNAECAFGIANMGNKGAIALRVTYADAGTADEEEVDGDNANTGESSAGRRTAEITFVATHLAAMEYNLRRRNANWASICSSCLFEDPKKILPQEYHLNEPGTKNTIEASTYSSSSTPGKQTDGGEDIPPQTEEECEALLRRDLHAASIPPDLTSRLHNSTIFKPGTHLFVAGDLNYRISTTPPKMATFPTLEDYSGFFERDQLTNEMGARRTFHGMSEAPVRFPPTYKIKHLSHDKATEAINSKEYKDALESGRQDEVVPWKWAPHRWPGWCDRIPFLDIPSWVKRRYESNSVGSSDHKPTPEIKILTYSSLPTMKSSDHQPVFLRASVPLLTPEELSPPEPDELTDEDKLDPRVQLPVPVDFGSFERRAVARRREIFTGMTTLFFSTKEGGLALAAVAAVGLWTWWLYQGFF